MKKLTFIWILIFSFQVFAQVKPVALKFDEFSRNEKTEYWKKPISEDFRIKRFAKELKKHPQMKGVIIRYDARKQTYYGNTETRNENSFGWEFEQNGISANGLVIIFGGIREQESFEFWLLPKGAEMPVPTPIFRESDGIFCPLIQIYSNSRKNLTNSKIELSSELEYKFPTTNVAYEWIVSEGTIIKGTNSPKMELDISKVQKSQVSVKLLVKGLDLECKNEEVITIPIVSFPFKFSEFDDSYNENVKMNLYYLEEELKKNSDLDLEVKMFYYPSRIDPLKSQARTLRDLYKGLAFSGFPKDKIKIEFGGYRDEIMFEIWVYPQGTEAPQPTPTVDARFVKSPAKGKRKNK